MFKLNSTKATIMVYCVAYGCKSSQNNVSKEKGITFHRFPSEIKYSDQHKEWTRRVRRKDWMPSKRSVLCSKHFSDECFDRTGQTVRLRVNSLPTIFNYPSSLQNFTKPRKGPTSKRIKIEDAIPGPSSSFLQPSSSSNNIHKFPCLGTTCTENMDPNTNKDCTEFSFTAPELNIKIKEEKLDHGINDEELNCGIKQDKLNIRIKDKEIKKEIVDESDNNMIWFIKEEPNSDIIENGNSTTNSCNDEMKPMIIDNESKTSPLHETPDNNQKLPVDREFIIKCDPLRYSSISKHQLDDDPQDSLFMGDMSSKPSSSNDSTEVTHQEKKERIFVCQICPYKTERQYSMKVHMKIHTGERNFHCILCDYKAATKAHLQSHMKIHTGEKDFHCNLCDYKTSQSFNLKIHMKTHTGEKSFHCNLCNYKAALSDHLKKHMKTHGDGVFQCNLCDYQASQSIVLKSHMKTHPKEKKYHCNSCDYKAAYSSTLKWHMKIHAEKDFHCNLCDYKTSRSTRLNNHMKTHTGEKNFPCNLCDYKAAQITRLKYHMRTHTGEKNYHCNLCDYKAAQSISLKNHMLKHQ